MDLTMYSNLVVSAFQDVVNLLRPLPMVIVSLIVLAVGFFIAKLAGDLVGGILKEIKLDQLFSSLGLTSKKDKISLSAMLSSLVSGGIALISLIVAFSLMESDAVIRTAETVIMLLPSLAKAIIILVVADMLAKFAISLAKLFTSVTKHEDNMTVEKVIHYGIYIFAVILAVDQIPYLRDAVPHLKAAIMWVIGVGIGYSTLPAVRELVDRIVGGKRK